MNNYDTLKAWADIVIERWEAKIRQQKINDSGELLKSFEVQLHADANGNDEKIVFTYLYYGKFPDMGVGKGVPLDMVGKKGTRQAKPWQGSIFMNEVRKLGEIMAEKTGQQAVINIIEGIK